MKKVIHVAVAAIIDAENRVLITLRQAHQHQGDLWEFPGGKVEKTETVLAALKREISEEVALDVITAEPLLQVSHDYGDRTVLLDVWHVQQFNGTAYGQEGQELRWCAISDLVESEFPAANVPIISALHSLLNT